MNYVATLFAILLFFSMSSGQRNPCKLEVDKAPTLRGLRLGMTPEQVAKVLNVDVRLTSQETTVLMTKVHGRWTDFNKGKTSVSFFERLNKNKLARQKYDRERRAAEHSVDAGEKRFYYSKIKETSTNYNLDGVQSIYLNFYRESLYLINIFYETTGVEWKDSTDFALTVSEALNIPATYWIEPGFMLCPGFTMNAYGKGRDSFLLLQDTRKRIELLSVAQRLFVQTDLDAEKKRTEKEFEERKKKASNFKP